MLSVNGVADLIRLYAQNDSSAGDIVTATALPGQPGRVVIERITGDGGRLSLEAAQNCVGIAALEALEMLKASHGSPTCGVSLVLEKVLPSRVPWDIRTAGSKRLSPYLLHLSEAVH